MKNAHFSPTRLLARFLAKHIIFLYLDIVLVVVLVLPEACVLPGHPVLGRDVVDPLQNPIHLNKIMHMGVTKMFYFPSKR